MDWTAHYPDRVDEKTGQLKSPVRFADVGCGFGGLLISLAPMFPDTQILGMEIRLQVSEYVKRRIAALRDQHRDTTGDYQNISIIRGNAMKFLPNFFEKGQVPGHTTSHHNADLENACS